MPFDRPTLQELRERIAADFELHTNGNPHLRGSLEFGQVNALTGIAHSLYGALDFYAKQLFDDTAEDEFILRRAAPYGLTLIAAVAAQGGCFVEGNDGVVIPEGTLLQAPNGQLYSVDADATIGPPISGSVGLNVTAVEPGIAGNQTYQTQLTFIEPIPGADSFATVNSGGIVGGAEQETMERFKQRFAERKAKPPRGGSSDDYIAWVKQASVDVDRVWVYPHVDEFGNTEYGAVTIFFTTTDPLNPVPDGPLLTTVQNYLDQLSIRPIGAKEINVTALGQTGIYIVFDELTPNTPEVQAAIVAELRDLILRESEPNGRIYLSHIKEAISNATGETDHVISAPTADIEADFGEFIVLGEITWPGA